MATESAVPEEPQADGPQASQGARPPVRDGLEPVALEFDEQTIGRPPATGGRRFVSLEERNQRYVEADALLDEQTKKKHPEVALAGDAFKQQYRDRWVAIAITEIDYNYWIVKGRVFATARSRRSLFRRIKALREEYPQLAFIDHFAGEFKAATKTIAQDV